MDEYNKDLEQVLFARNQIPLQAVCYVSVEEVWLRYDER